MGAAALAVVAAFSISGCGNDEPGPVVVAEIEPTAAASSVAADPAGDLPLVEFANLEDCRGELSDVDVRPIFEKTVDFAGGYDYLPAWTGDVCTWQWNATNIDVVTAPDSSHLSNDSSYDRSRGEALDVDGFSAGWTNESGVTFLALAQDGRAFTCAFRQLDALEEMGDIVVAPADVAQEVEKVCAAILTKLQGADASASPEPVPTASEDSVVIATPFYLEPFAEGCDKFEDLDTTELLGEDVTPSLTLGDQALAMSCDFDSADADAPGPRVSLELEMGSESWGATVKARELRAPAPWNHVFLDHFSGTGSSFDQVAGGVLLETTDTGAMFRFECRYVGEPQDDPDDVTVLLDEVADREAATTTFCTQALSLAIVRIEG